MLLILRAFHSLQLLNLYYTQSWLSAASNENNNKKSSAKLLKRAKNQSILNLYPIFIFTQEHLFD